MDHSSRAVRTSKAMRFHFRGNDINVVGPCLVLARLLAVACAVTRCRARADSADLHGTSGGVKQAKKLGFLPAGLFAEIDPYLRPYMTHFTKCFFSGGVSRMWAADRKTGDRGRSSGYIARRIEQTALFILDEEKPETPRGAELTNVS